MIATAVAQAPRPVRVVVGVAAGVAVSPGAVAAEVRARRGSALAPFRRLPLAPTCTSPSCRGQASVGIEYPTMIFLGTGTAGALTTHEVAHQWFYGLVGNDQARDPVLDEGLATYAMGSLFPGAVVPGRLAAPHGRADDRTGTGCPTATTSSRSTSTAPARCARSAPARLVDCALRVYVARNAYGIATQAGPGARARDGHPIGARPAAPLRHCRSGAGERVVTRVPGWP